MRAVKDIEFTQIAADWNSIKLGEESPQALLAMRNGLTTKQDQDKGDYKVSRIETIGGGWIDETRVRFASDVREKDVENYRIQKGDILFSHINSDPHLGKTGFAERDYEDLLHGMNLLLIRANPDVFEAAFLNRVFQYYRNIGVFISICSRSVNQSSINQAKLKAVEVPLPPLPEQKKIAHILSTVQRAIEAQERIIQTTTELKKALMHKLFTEGLRHEPQKQTEIGPVPESWEVVDLGDVINLFAGYAFKSDEGISESNTQLLRMGNLYQNTLDLNRSPIFYPDSFAAAHKRFVLKKDDLVMSLTGTSGKEDYGFTVRIPKTDKTLLLNQRVTRIDVTDHRLQKDFAHHFLLSRKFLDHLYPTAKGMKQANLSTNAMKKLKVVLPGAAEQSEIATCFKSLDQKVVVAGRKVAALQDLFSTLLHELMTAKTRVHKNEITV
jgi:type I restriction enzyme, S subunit